MTLHESEVAPVRGTSIKRLKCSWAGGAPRASRSAVPISGPTIRDAQPKRGLVPIPASGTRGRRRANLDHDR